MSSCYLVALLNLHLPALEASAKNHTEASPPLRAPAFHYEGGFNLAQLSSSARCNSKLGVGLTSCPRSTRAEQQSPGNRTDEPHSLLVTRLPFALHPHDLVMAVNVFHFLLFSSEAFRNYFPLHRY